MRQTHKCKEDKATKKQLRYSNDKKGFFKQGSAFTWLRIMKKR